MYHFAILCVSSFLTGIIHSQALCPGLSQWSHTSAVWLICLPGEDSCAVTAVTFMPVVFYGYPVSLLFAHILKHTLYNHQR